MAGSLCRLEARGLSDANARMMSVLAGHLLQDSVVFHGCLLSGRGAQGCDGVAGGAGRRDVGAAARHQVVGP